MREAGVVVAKDGTPIFWHTPGDRTVVELPDNRTLWEVLWENRTTVQGFAHSHPGSGVPGPSYTDVTTFAAIESSLGARLDWWITSQTHVALFRWTGPDRHSYTALPMESEPTWVSELRVRSNYQDEKGR